MADVVVSGSAPPPGRLPIPREVCGRLISERGGKDLPEPLRGAAGRVERKPAPVGRAAEVHVVDAVRRAREHASGLEPAPCLRGALEQLRSVAVAVDPCEPQRPAWVLEEVTRPVGAGLDGGGGARLDAVELADLKLVARLWRGGEEDAAGARGESGVRPARLSLAPRRRVGGLARVGQLADEGVPREIGERGDRQATDGCETAGVGAVGSPGAEVRLGAGVRPGGDRLEEGAPGAGVRDQADPGPTGRFVDDRPARRLGVTHDHRPRDRVAPVVRDPDVGGAVGARPVRFRDDVRIAVSDEDEVVPDSDDPRTPEVLVERR